MRSEATRAKAIGGMSHVFAMATGAITDMIFTGVFERFPELQVCWIETGVGWIPHFLECLDDRWWRNRVWGDLPLKEPPSFYWYRNNAASFIIDRTGVELRNRVGVENMMWSSDYPHHGNDWPYSRKTIEEMMGGDRRAGQGADHRGQRGADLEPVRLTFSPTASRRRARRRRRCRWLRRRCGLLRA